MILRVVFFPGEGAIELLVLTSDSERDAFPYPSGSSREFLAGFGPFDVLLVKPVQDSRRSYALVQQS